MVFGQYNRRALLRHWFTNTWPVVGGWLKSIIRCACVFYYDILLAETLLRGATIGVFSVIEIFIEIILIHQLDEVQVMKHAAANGTDECACSDVPVRRSINPRI